MTSATPRARAPASLIELTPSPGWRPEPAREREGIALCLSGGGFRAALFHLGALRRLNETGVLSRVTTVSSVSGGSVIAAHLARSIGHDWPAEGTSLADWEHRVEAPFRRFCAMNIRTPAILSRLLPWHWFDSATAVHALVGRYAADLNPATLPELPERPRYIFSATDLAYGVNWIFSRESVGDYRAGYLHPEGRRFDVATAVGASSCFPPVFNPLPAGVAPEELVLPPHAVTDEVGETPQERAALIRSLRLSDGGLYDNLGLEPVWKRHRYVLVSDGGAVFRPAVDQGLFWRLGRYLGVQGAQVNALRKRWLIASFEDPGEDSLDGTYWGLGSTTDAYAETDSDDRRIDLVPGYGEDLVHAVVSRVRTDFDHFTDDEMGVLMNHGYLLAEAAIRRWTPQLRRPQAPPAAVPFPSLMDAGVVRWALADSHRTLLLGRF